MYACVIQSLIYLRKEKINGDIRIKNIIMDNNIYLYIIDFSDTIAYSNINNKSNIITKCKKHNNLAIFIGAQNIKNYTSICIDFLDKLFIIDYINRIGFNNIEGLKNHLWFKGFIWEKLKKN